MRSSLTALLSPSPGFFDCHGYCLASSLLKNIPFDSASHSIFPLILNPKCHKKSPLFTVSSSVFYSPIHRSMDLAITLSLNLLLQWSLMSMSHQNQFLLFAVHPTWLAHRLDLPFWAHLAFFLLAPLLKLTIKNWCYLIRFSP